MIGLVLVAHAPLGSALLDCASHVYGRPPEACRVVDVAADVDPAHQLAAARAAVDAVDEGAGVLVLVDLFGATPGNIAVKLAREDRVEVLAGVNLPMVLKVLCDRGSLDLATLAEKAALGASGAVMRVASTPPQEQKRFATPLVPCGPVDGGADETADPRADDGDARLPDQQ